MTKSAILGGQEPHDHIPMLNHISNKGMSLVDHFCPVLLLRSSIRHVREIAYICASLISILRWAVKARRHTYYYYTRHKISSAVENADVKPARQSFQCIGRKGPQPSPLLSLTLCDVLSFSQLRTTAFQITFNSTRRATLASTAVLYPYPFLPILAAKR